MLGLKVLILLGLATNPDRDLASQSLKSKLAHEQEDEQHF